MRPQIGHVGILMAHQLGHRTSALAVMGSIPGPGVFVLYIACTLCFRKNAPTLKRYIAGNYND